MEPYAYPASPSSEPVRGRFHSASSHPYKLVGGLLFGLVGAAVGGAAGALIGGHAEINLGLLIGAGLGLVTGATVGDSARHGAEETYHSSPEELLGYIVFDRDGHRIGTITAVYVDAAGEPRYLGVSTVWMPTTTAHLVPLSAAHFAQDHRRVRIDAVSEVIRTAPSCRLDGAVDADLEESLRQHYEPHGIAITTHAQAGQALRAHPANIAPEAALDEEPVDVPITGVAFSGDAPYRSSANAVLQGRTGSGPRSSAAPSGSQRSGLAH